MEKEKKECNCKTPLNKREENEAILENVYGMVILLLRVFSIETLFSVPIFLSTFLSSSDKKEDKK